MEDKIGHGTYTLGLIMEAPIFAIYLAKVEDGPEFDTMEHLQEASTWGIIFDVNILINF